MFVCISKHSQAHRYHQSIIYILQHPIISNIRTQLVGRGCNMLGQLQWDKSLEAKSILLKSMGPAQPLSSCFSTKKNNSLIFRCTKMCRHLPWGRTAKQTPSAQTHTGLSENPKHVTCKQTRGSQKPWGWGRRLWSSKRIHNVRVGSFSLFLWDVSIFIHSCEQKKEKPNLQHHNDSTHCSVASLNCTARDTKMKKTSHWNSIWWIRLLDMCYARWTPTLQAATFEIRQWIISGFILFKRF